MQKITKEQSKDTGIVFGLVLLFAGIAADSTIYLKLSFAFILAALIIPSTFKYPAVVWFKISEILGFFVSKIVLAVIYIIVVLPVSFIRKIFRSDSMMIRGFGKSDKGFWIKREHKYTNSDFIKPF